MNFEYVKKELFKILDTEYRLYCELVEIFKKEQDALLNDDIKLLNILIFQGEEKIHRIKFLEERRGELLKEGYPITKLGLFIERLSDEDEKEQFRNLRDKLLLKIDELRQLRDTNELIINKTLKFLRFYIDLLSKESGFSVYGERGSLNFNKKLTNRLDEKV